MNTFLWIVLVTNVIVALLALIRMTHRRNRRIDEHAMRHVTPAVPHRTHHTVPVLWVAPKPHHYTGPRWSVKPAPTPAVPDTLDISLPRELADTHEVYLLLKPHKVDEIVQRIM